MSRTTPEVKRYSTAFKMKVVSEIEQGKFSIDKAKKIYDIGGGQTIQNWIKRFGKNELLSKVVRIEMKDEKDKYNQLMKEKQQLESALAQSRLEVLALDSLVEIAKETYGIDLKKNNGKEQLTLQKKKSKKKDSK